MKKQSYLLALLILLCTCIIYSNHFNNAFHFDDSHTIQNNLYIRSLANIPLFFKDARTFSNLPQNQSYRPVVSTTLALDYWMGKGYNLFYFHLSSFLMFLALGVLLFIFFFKIYAVSTTSSKINQWPVLFTAAFAVTWYMLHPANAETINYIIARSDLQSTFFVILAFIMYIKSGFSRKTFLYLLPIGIGALAKPTAIMFAPLLLIYIIFFEEKLSITELFQKSNFKKLTAIIKKTYPSFIFCAFLYFVIDKMTPSTWLSGGSSVTSYLITQPFVVAHYFGVFFLPAGLTADTDWGLLENIWNIRFFAGILFITMILLTAFYCSAKISLRPISFGILWFFICLIPTSSVIPFSEVLNYHRVFFPYIGLAIGTCWSFNLIIHKLKERVDLQTLKGTVIIASCLLLCTYAYSTFERNKIWRTEESLWYDVTIQSPTNGRGQMNYGLVKMSVGDYVSAEKYFQEAFKSLPYYYTLHINMVILKNSTGDKITAEQYFKKGIEYGNSYPGSWFYYARFLISWSRYDDAIPMLTKAIDLSPAYLDARILLMKAYQETNQRERLAALVLQTLQLDPGNKETLSFLEASKKSETDKTKNNKGALKIQPIAEK